MRWYATQGDVVLKTRFKDLKRLVRPETIAHQNLGFAGCSQLGLGLKHKPQPIEANLCVCVARLRTCKVPPGSGVRRPCASAFRLVL